MWHDISTLQNPYSKYCLQLVYAAIVPCSVSPPRALWLSLLYSPRLVRPDSNSAQAVFAAKQSFVHTDRHLFSRVLPLFLQAAVEPHSGQHLQPCLWPPQVMGCSHPVRQLAHIVSQLYMACRQVRLCLSSLKSKANSSWSVGLVKEQD